MNTKTKVRLFKVTVESVLLYNLETWSINKNMQKRIDAELHQNAENGNQYIMERENNQRSSLSRPAATFPNNKGKTNETSRSLHKTHH